MFISRIQDFVLSIPEVKAGMKRWEINKQHRKNEIYATGAKKRKKYYIIRYSDGMSCGWTVWERVALYGAIYAEDHHMIPVVDMQSTLNIYLEEKEVGVQNAWEKYYKPVGGVSYNDAIASGSYILADPSQEWFEYIRMRTPRRFTVEFLREKYNKYIRLNSWTEKRCVTKLNGLLNGEGLQSTRMLGVCLRGSDYRLFHHPMQPDTDYVISKIKSKYAELDCNCIYIATEDHEILLELIEKLKDYKIVTYKAGQIKKAEGLIGKQIRKQNSAEDAAIDYLTILYALNSCVGLIGGKCGATIVAEYRKNPPYEYFEVKDMKQAY